MTSPSPRRGGIPPLEKRTEKCTFTDQLKLFREQPLEVAGDMYVRGSRFQRSKKHHAELRGSTIVVFRTSQVARMQEVGIESVISVIFVSQYSVEILQKDGGVPRIYIKYDPGENDSSLMYIKVMGGKRELHAWRYGLARAVKYRLPRLRDITIESVIGRGGGGKVFMVFWKNDDAKTPFALKVIEKTQAFKSPKSFRHVASERSLMEKIGQHPFLLPMHFAFQTEKNLFIGTPFCPGGDLAAYLRANGDQTFPCAESELIHLHVGDQKRRRVYGRLSESQTRLIASELILGLEHLHKKGIVYRDLKPENVFIDRTGHIKLGDYGLAKNLEEWKKTAGDQNRTASVCGTRNYLPPEMLFGRMYSFEADLWSLGVMLYRIMCGAFPFEAARSKELFYKVKVQQPLLPSGLSNHACKLLEGLLQKDPRNRLKLADLKRHSFFCNVNWDDVYNRRADPCVPDVQIGPSELDALDNFELSKLQGITVGEYVAGGYGGNLEEDLTGVPSHKQDVQEMMIGFEYGCVQNDEEALSPLEVKQMIGGVMRVTSNDQDTPRAERKGGGFLSKVFSFDEMFSKMASVDDLTKSPRAVRHVSSGLPDEDNQKN